MSAFRKTRRQVVRDAAAIGAIYAAGWGQRPALVEAAPEPTSVPASTVVAQLDRLAALVADTERNILTAAPYERERLAEMLGCVEYQCRTSLLKKRPVVIGPVAGRP